MTHQKRNSSQSPSLLKKLTIASLAVSMSLLSITSFAEGNGGKRMFDRIDVDGNGVISFDEFKPPRMDKPRKADLNEDGQLTQEEVIEHAQQRGDDMVERASEHFAKMDLDGNGIVTSEEAREAAFYRMDKDQDGYLSPEELKRPKRGKGRRHSETNDKG